MRLPLKRSEQVNKHTTKPISMPKYALKQQNWKISFGIQLIRRHVKRSLKRERDNYSVT